MKKAAIVVIIICLVVFITTLTAGVYLAARTIGWSDLTDSSKISYHINDIIGNFRILDNFHGSTSSYSIDELHTSELADIETISISGLAEDITIVTGDATISARLSGNYRTRGRKITWLAEKKGTELKIHADYPGFGLVSSDLSIDVNIPAGFAGDVKVNTLSGPCRLPDIADYAWNSFTFDGLSGRLEIENSVMDEINFNSLSGSIELNRSAARISGETMSGHVRINLDNIMKTDIETLSGEVSLSIPADAACTIEFSTMSGSFRNDGLDLNYQKQERRSTTALMNNGGTQITVETMSGNLITNPR